MTDKEFTESRNAILNYCERNNLQTEVSETEHEVDFIMDFGSRKARLGTLPKRLYEHCKWPYGNRQTRLLDWC